jgi:hypothetical protein
MGIEELKSKHMFEIKAFLDRMHRQRQLFVQETLVIIEAYIKELKFSAEIKIGPDGNSGINIK